MKLTAQQIINTAPFATYIRVDGIMYRMDYCMFTGAEEQLVFYSDADSGDGYGDEYATSVDDLAKNDVAFFKLTEIEPQ